MMLTVSYYLPKCVSTAIFWVTVGYLVLSLVFLWLVCWKRTFRVNDACFFYSPHVFHVIWPSLSVHWRGQCTDHKRYMLLLLCRSFSAGISMIICSWILDCPVIAASVVLSGTFINVVECNSIADNSLHCWQWCLRWLLNSRWVLDLFSVRRIWPLSVHWAVNGRSVSDNIHSTPNSVSIA